MSGGWGFNLTHSLIHSAIVALELEELTASGITQATQLIKTVRIFAFAFLLYFALKGLHRI